MSGPWHQGKKVGQRTQKQAGTQDILVLCFPPSPLRVLISRWQSASSSSSSRRPPSSSITSQSSLSTSLDHAQSSLSTFLYQLVSIIIFSRSTCLYHFHLYQLLSIKRLSINLSPFLSTFRVAGAARNDLCRLSGRWDAPPSRPADALDASSCFCGCFAVGTPRCSAGLLLCVASTTLLFRLCGAWGHPRCFGWQAQHFRPSLSGLERVCSARHLAVLQTVGTLECRGLAGVRRLRCFGWHMRHFLSLSKLFAGWDAGSGIDCVPYVASAALFVAHATWRSSVDCLDAGTPRLGRRGTGWGAGTPRLPGTSCCFAWQAWHLVTRCWLYVWNAVLAKTFCL